MSNTSDEFIAHGNQRAVSNLKVDRRVSRTEGAVKGERIRDRKGALGKKDEQKKKFLVTWWKNGMESIYKQTGNSETGRGGTIGFYDTETSVNLLLGEAKCFNKPGHSCQGKRRAAV